MQRTSRGFSAFSPALPTLLTSFWKARPRIPITYLRNAKLIQLSTNSSIEDAMLGRAVQQYEPHAEKREKSATHAPSTNQTTTIESMLKSSSQASQKSLGGFTKYLNPTAIPPTSFSRSPIRNTTSSIDQRSRSLKRTSSEMNRLANTLNSTTAFAERPAVIDLTQDKGFPIAFGKFQGSSFDFDPNDFEDDSDLDLDVEYPQALPSLSVDREQLNLVEKNIGQRHLSTISSTVEASKNPLPASSALTWSSSPPSHKLAPREALKHQPAENIATTILSISPSESSIDANPRPAKRRSIPSWVQEEEEKRRSGKEVDGRKNGGSSSETICVDEDLPRRSNKDESLPWNTTASAIKEQRGAFKEQRGAFKNQNKKAAKDSAFSSAEMQEIAATSQKLANAPIKLSSEQEKVLNLVVNQKKSVFFTGSAGTGKSVLMRSIIEELRRKYAFEREKVAVTASTGLAACNIGGVTLHSFAGIALGKETAPELIKKIKRNPKAKNRWLKTKVLIIDEISMVDGDLFDKLEQIAREMRKTGNPFGGIQLVVTGDFFQLPPVPDNGSGRAVKFAFDAGTWSTSIDHTIGLTEVFRQKDPVFASMLNEMRLGRISDETVKAFKKLERPIKYEDALDATELFPTRREVENANAFKMRALIGQEYQFRAEDSGAIRDTEHRDKLLANCMAPPLLTLKKGAQVMLIKNLDDNLVNGSIGRVHAFMTERTFEIYDRDSDLFEADRDGEAEENDNKRDSRNKLKSMINKDLIADTGRVYPVVRFTLPDGTSRDLLCQPEEWKVELPNGEVQAQRRQLPLILAWALSIHKAQGQTLQRVTVDLRKTFEKGQAYVALSRATCQEGLQVKGFDKRQVMAHPKVAEFYDTLYSVNTTSKQSKYAG